MYLLTSCVSLPDPETSQDFTSDIVATITSEQSVGQSFISRRARLSGISIWVKSEAENPLLFFALFHSPNDSSPIFSTNLYADDEITTISFPPIPDPPGSTYYFQITIPTGEINILGRDEDNYPYGNAYLDQKTIEADLAFRTTYDYDWMAVFSDFGRLAGQTWIYLALGLLLLLPGWLLLDFANLRKSLDTGEQIAFSVGLSLALIPNVMLWTTTLGWQWNQFSVRIGSILLLAVFIWRKVRSYRLEVTSDKLQVTSDRLQVTGDRSQVSGYKLRQSFSSSLFTSHFSLPTILLAIFAIALFIRFAMVRDLATPAWVDSIHHSLITQGILENGGFPENNLPHIPIEANQYHPGYHSSLAVFIWLTGLTLPDGMLIFGQTLNALMVFAVYALTTTLVKDKNAGWVAGLITGVFSLMPAYYTSWGRYTQLAGLLILPAGLWLLKISNKISHQQFGGKNHHPQKNEANTSIWIKLFLGGVLFAGVFLVHYRVLIFLLLLIGSDWIGQLYRPNRFSRINLVDSIKTIVFAGLIGSLISLPWLIPTLTEFVLPKAIKWTGAGAAYGGVNWRYLTPASGVPILILAGLGLLWGIIQRRRFVISIFVWVILLFAIAKPNPFGVNIFPTFVNQTSMEIMLFIPISILAGYFVSQAIHSLKKLIPPKLRMSGKIAVFFLGIGLTIWGAQRLLPVLNPVTILSRDRDRAAMNWMAEHIPQDEVIVINPTGWGYGLYMGNDGGYWIPILTNHQTMPPNALYGLDSQNRTHINQFVEELFAIGEDAEQIWQLLAKNEYAYIYIGGRGGVISPQALKENQLFEVQYHYLDTWVFKALDKR